MVRTDGHAGTAERERHDLAALLEELGPDAATLCAGWTTRDLAAHIVLREGRPDAAVGLAVKPLAGHTARVQDRIAHGDWAGLLGRLRRPPLWAPARIPGVDDLANALELFVHHEDVRRAQAGWAPRPLPPAEADLLWAKLRWMARLLFRRVPVGVVLVRTDATTGSSPVEVRAGGGEPTVRVSGPVGELVTFAYGRGEHARVELDGPDDAVAALSRAPLGL